MLLCCSYSYSCGYSYGYGHTYRFGYIYSYGYSYGYRHASDQLSNAFRKCVYVLFLFLSIRNEYCLCAKSVRTEGILLSLKNWNEFAKS